MVRLLGWKVKLQMCPSWGPTLLQHRWRGICSQQIRCLWSGEQFSLVVLLLCRRQECMPHGTTCWCIKPAAQLEAL
jgi:hypothetical protein